ncbi:MAG: ImmA/IrrE family metallo-endopeptidase [Maledivibacter sp.]|jgi:hypothetical protein|nr:ImmA/IrrE family metallo-endopeptidase [Maledivibacter sp.]
MIGTEQLESIVNKANIIKEFAPLPYSALGYFYSDGDFHLILINKEIRKDERLYRTILAEEIGHYMTTVGDYTPRREMTYSEKIDIDKKELLALRWTTDFLIPTELLLKAIKDRLVGNFEEMLDYFYVTEEFLLHKLRFMAKEKMKWEIDDRRYLVLSGLPSLYVFEDI